jgi:hypothetical protein
VRLALAALCACASFACATPAVLERAGGSTTTDSRATTLRAVKRAATLESGALLLCVELRSFQRRQVSVEVPLQAIGKPRERTGFDFGREPGFDGPSPDDPSALRYVFNEDDFEPGCPEDEIDKPLPIYTSKRGSRGPGVYTSRVGRSLALHYVSAKPIWSSLRDLEIAPVLGNEEVEVEVPGKPIYYLALPFAFVLDTVFALFTLGLVF